MEPNYQGSYIGQRKIREAHIIPDDLYRTGDEPWWTVEFEDGETAQYPTMLLVSVVSAEPRTDAEVTDERDRRMYVAIFLALEGAADIAIAANVTPTRDAKQSQDEAVEAWQESKKRLLESIEKYNPTLQEFDLILDAVKTIVAQVTDGLRNAVRNESKRAVDLLFGHPFEKRTLRDLSHVFKNYAAESEATPAPADKVGGGDDPAAAA